jgi:hypothetical protein
MRQILQAAITAAMLSLIPANIASAAPGPKPLFASDDVLHLTIKASLGTIPREATAKPIAGTLTVNGAATESLPVELSARGITRRRKDVCTFPPLRVDFTQKPGDASLFKGQKRLKLVTHCQRADRYQQYVLLEYAAYRLYAALTPESFGARLAEIDYVDADGSAIATRMGFFIEDVDDVARRNGQERLRGAKSITISQLNPAAAARFALYQYMVSNLDWSMTGSPPGEDCCHNSRLAVLKGATTDIVPLPYDFDYAGLVDAPYAVPPDSIKLANVRVRRYRGFCAHNEQAKAYIAELSSRRAALLTLLDKTPEMEQGSRQKAGSYLAGFFDQVATPDKVADMMGACLK